MITAGTYQKAPLFSDDERLGILHDTLLKVVGEQGWDPLAWAAFSNHYHLLAIAPDTEDAVRRLTAKVHGLSARELNLLDGTPGRTVWYRCWDTRITYEKSIMARIAYVHYNAVRHGIVQRAEDYPWCSARWFLQHGDRPFVESVLSFKTDKVNVYDDY
jgi:putative transposase